MSIGSFAAASARLFTRPRVDAANDADPNLPKLAPDLRELARRTVPRDLIDHLTIVTVAAAEMLDARLIDISPYGFQARARGPILMRGERVTVRLPMVGEHDGHVMWGLKGLFGCKFFEPIEPDLYLRVLESIRATGPVPIETPSG